MISEAKRIENENEVKAGIAAQADLSLKYVTDVVNSLVTDTNLAKSVIDAVATKFAAQKAGFAKAVEDEFNEDDGDELVADFTV